MSSVTEKLDEVMEQASQALADMDYLTCEALCVQALTEAGEQKQYRYYARVLLPLQEARRQRRMIAAQGDVLLGGGDRGVDWEAWLEQGMPGCVVMTQPNTLEDAAALAERARVDSRYIEVLFADNKHNAVRWILRAYEGPDITCECDAPTAEQDAAQWFLNATEQLGDAALASVDDSLIDESLVHDIEARLRVFPDHELLHQALAQAARTIDSQT